MTELLTIGQFARHTGLTTRALRLYHRAGLIAPAATSLATGYRYYNRDQLPLAQRIKALRATGLPIAEIGLVLASEEPRRAKAQLDGHRARLERQIDEAQRSLARLESLISWIEQQAEEATMVAQERVYTCSFCAKKSPEVERMIAGPNGVIICNQCIDLCNRIITDEREKSSSASGDPS